VKREPDPVELEYERAIARAAGHGDSDRAQELATGLAQYREFYQDRFAAWAGGMERGEAADAARDH
jgi:hypothetical protein